MATACLLDEIVDDAGWIGAGLWQGERQALAQIISSGCRSDWVS